MDTQEQMSIDSGETEAVITNVENTNGNTVDVPDYSLRHSDSVDMDESDSEEGESETDNIPILSKFKKLIKKMTKSEYPAASINADEMEYNMNHAKRGKCLIFNHFKFKNTTGLSDRDGTEKDVDLITEIFTSLGFDVDPCHDLKLEQIKRKLKEVSNENHSENDCLVVFVLTHGDVDQLYAFDEPYKPSELWYYFRADKCSTLATKPKLFFLQACSGHEVDRGTKVEVKRTFTDSPVNSGGSSTYRIPNQADFLTVFSSHEGYVSYRSGLVGSRFIFAVCRYFLWYHDREDVFQMLTRANHEVAIYCGTKSKKKQVLHITSSLTRFMFLKTKPQPIQNQN